MPKYLEDIINAIDLNHFTKYYFVYNNNLQRKVTRSTLINNHWETINTGY
jgi:hypothetical protein